MLTALIVDDEPLAREELRLLLEQAGNIRLLGECAHAMEALPAIHRLKPDLLFLDIQMPRISGLELVSMLDPDLRPTSSSSPPTTSLPCAPLRRTPSTTCSNRSRQCG